MTAGPTDGAPPDVRVGIVTWNSADLLDACLDALPAALDGLAAEIVVVDNASADGSVDVARRHDGVRVIANTDNLGYAKGMNQALAGTAAPVLIALNPDTAASPGSLAALVDLVRSRPRVGLAVPALANADGSAQFSVLRFPTVRVALAVAFVPRWVQRVTGLGSRLCLPGHAPQGGSIDWAIGAVHAIRADALEGEAPYSERWFMYVEDLELCWRLARRGWDRVYEPGVEVPHVGNASGALAWGARRERRFWRATYDWYRLAHGGLAVRALAAANVLGAGWVALRAAVASLAGGSRAGERRQRARALVGLLPTHARVIVFGPPAPDTEPPAAG